MSPEPFEKFFRFFPCLCIIRNRRTHSEKQFSTQPMHPESSRNDKRRTAFDGLHRWTVVPGQLGWQGILSDLMRTTIFSTSKLDEDHQVSQKIGKEDDV
ncbi:hypothetical protein B9Z55_027899 [Caenorhabditis nigoni]|uniref:Uncharacterized protein n=1 Tax=Caenorhabditis nigoni TaxID=1611254 RepID=A0A2G5SDY0_9PELO|nr:hypothetical protein B9Z55_027899 [Caenorhabditis nigoni]